MFGPSLPFRALKTLPRCGTVLATLWVKDLSDQRPEQRSPRRGCDMTEDDVAILESDAIRAVRRAFDAIEQVTRHRMSREEACELFDQSLTAHDEPKNGRASGR